MTELLGPWENRKRALKSLIEDLHRGASPEGVKRRFAEILKGLTPEEISRVEQELIEEGLPREEVQRLCDVHIEVFKDALRGVVAEEWHPLSILMHEHDHQIKTAERLVSAVEEGRMEEVGELMEALKETESHYLREENVLFPYLEKHGISEPPAIMWMEHDEIRAMKKRLEELKSGGDKEGLKEEAEKLRDALSSHFFKENNILFPTAMNVVEESEWVEIRREFDRIGYCCITPPDMPQEMVYERVKEEGRIELPTGSFTLKELETLLNTLPVEITFVDADDRVRYFNDRSDMVFLRTKAVLGRSVQRCHPKKSIDVVNKILEDFRSGRRDVAEFWINFKGRFIHIRYFPLRDSSGNYLGTVEVTQDVTDIRKLEGERRLLDE